MLKSLYDREHEMFIILFKNRIHNQLRFYLELKSFTYIQGCFFFKKM